MRLNPFAKPKPPSPAEVLRAIDAVPELRDAVVEAYTAPYDPDANLSAEQGGALYYRGLLHSSRDLPDYDHKRAVSLSYKLADYNPIARRVANISKTYVIGSGVSWAVYSDDEDEASKARAAKLEEVLRRFWDAPHNKMALKLPARIRALSITGEQCWSVAVDAAGQVRVGYVDPDAIEATIPDPRNSERDAAVVLRAQKPGGEPVVLKCVAIGEVVGQRGYGRRMPAAEGETFSFAGMGTGGGDLTGVYAGSCFFWKVNGPPNARRGRPDVLAAIDWIDAHEQVLANDVDRTDFQTRFVADVTLTGADEQAVKKRTNEIAKNPPKAGTVLVHNDSEAWAMLAPELRMQDAQAISDLLLSYVATGTDMPKLWLNGAMDVNRATASEMPEPTYMALEERQTFVQDMLAEVLCFVLDQAEIAGAEGLARDALNPEPWPITVSMPELVRKDLNPAATALQSVVTAITTALEGHVIDRHTALEAMVLALQNFGVKCDLAAMEGRIEAEREAAEEKAAEIAQQYPDTGVHVADQVDAAMRDESRRQTEALEQQAHTDRMLDTIGRLAEAMGNRPRRSRTPSRRP